MLFSPASDPADELLDSPLPPEALLESALLVEPPESELLDTTLLAELLLEERLDSVLLTELSGDDSLDSTLPTVELSDDIRLDELMLNELLLEDGAPPPPHAVRKKAIANSNTYLSLNGLIITPPKVNTIPYM